MIDPDSPQPTARSGPLCSHPGLHGADATTTSFCNNNNNNNNNGNPKNSTSSNEHNEQVLLPPGPLVNHGTPGLMSFISPSSSPSPSPGPADWIQNDNAPVFDICESPLLKIRTDVPPNASPMHSGKDCDPFLTHSCNLSSGSLSQRTPSVRGLRAGRNSSISSMSPATSVSSPQLVAMGDITPLPSPIGANTPWRLSRGDIQPLSLSRTPSTISRNGSGLNLRLSDSSQRVGRSASRSRTRLPYTSDTANIPEEGSTSKHARNRSLSDYVPPARSVSIKPRPVVVSGSGVPPGIAPSSSTDSKSNNGLHREHYLAVQRGIALPASRPLTPPRSSRGSEDDQQHHNHNNNEPVIHRSASVGDSDEIYSVRSIRTQQPRKYRKLCQLGQGTFSQVTLASRMEVSHADGISMDGASTIPHKLVAVKVIDYGPAGGADEERLEVSLKREVDILKSINHPSLVQLKAFGSDEKRALLVLDYCPGELVAAVRYLHANFIVHRDIKLENVLVTIPTAAMEKPIDWSTYDRAVVTLSDLGLSRRIPEPPESPLLHTRCGSEDYAAPEILMGQPYDGRSTDAWALGVSLYAMMENRLPFDALPGTRGDPAKLRARTPHRIARCDWSWYRYADSDDEWDPEKGKDWGEAHECVEGLLKRNTRRKTLDEIAAMPWVRDAINVPGGLKRGDQEVP